MTNVVAVIVDVVGSRKLADRAGAQRAILEAFAEADDFVKPIRPAWATFADEFQAIYATVADACAATTFLRLALPEGIDVRFGFGVGESVEVAQGETGPVLDGDAWWNARAAIDEAEKRESRKGSARTWLAAPDAGMTNSSLLLRDHVIGSMSDRERRIARDLLLGRTQTEIAKSEGISQAAVSQAAKRSGAGALVQAVEQWREK